MKPFFTPHRMWPGGGPYPHFLILLDRYPAYRAFVRAHHDLLAEYGERLGVVPEQWLHSTVQGIHHPCDAAQLDQLRAVSRRELRGLAPFTLQLGPTWPGITAITVAMYPENGMAELNRRVRVAADAVPGIALRDQPARFWPHTSLAYARDHIGDDERLNRALRALRPERVEITVDRVHLVNQRQDVEQGCYTWDVVEEFPLAG
ncbi:2'-5' RNA ligase family protein [Kitasatospora sp. NA04385]|uniref:2'-5' RNA ligase family protein n=1 Tax=Kitasatospora sp. NA04385 TaxID=2742135 RepID=UPI00158FA586|nr:2'-5' RNA ligase family protein [Kitasatospora sp. NA04385]QKW20555.1 2'-5' RNA ligase family protein [Kitasatospora sp. NA04385]